MNQTVDVNQAADLMKVHPKTVKEVIASGAIPAARIGRAYVMMTRDVVNYVDKMVSQQTAERMGAPKTHGRATKAARPGRSPAGSRSASSSDATCAR